MNDFAGENSIGDWSLSISDETIGNVATLQSWQLDLELFSDENIRINALLTANSLKIDIEPPGFVPIGAVMAWLGDHQGVPSLPDGWIRCDGQQIGDSESPLNGTHAPDMNRTGRFLRGGMSSGATGGRSNHHHGLGSNGGGIDRTGPGSYVTNEEHLPPYLEIIWIMRIK